MIKEIHHDEPANTELLEGKEAQETLEAVEEYLEGLEEAGVDTPPAPSPTTDEHGISFPKALELLEEAEAECALLRIKAASLESILEHLRQIEPAQLRRVSSSLMLRQGEFRACALALEKAIDLAHPPVLDEGPSRQQLTMDRAYGSLTIPLGAAHRERQKELQKKAMTTPERFRHMP